MHKPQQRLLKRNIHLLLTVYNYKPEIYMDRYGIDHDLAKVYAFFDGEILPNLTNQHRIALLLGVPMNRLCNVKNLVPLFLQHYQHMWHLSGKNLAKTFGIDEPVMNKWRNGVIGDESQQRELADGLGVKLNTLKSMISPKFYAKPVEEPHLSPMIKYLIKSSTSDVKLSVHDLYEQIKRVQAFKEGLDSSVGKFNQALAKSKLQKEKQACIVQYKGCGAHVLLLYKLTESVGNLQLYKYVAELDHAICNSNYTNSPSKAQVKLSKANKIADKILAVCSSRQVLEYTKSAKYIMIAGMTQDGFDTFDDTDRITYLVYGLDRKNCKLQAYDWTVKGLANLDPFWRYLGRRELGQLFSDDYDITSGSKSDQRTKACTLSRTDVRLIRRLLSKQGLDSHVTLLRTNCIDWWLNHHSYEYRDVGDEKI